MDSGCRAGVGPPQGASRSRRSSTVMSCPSRRGEPWPTAPAGTSTCSSVTRATSSDCSSRSRESSGGHRAAGAERPGRPRTRPGRCTPIPRRVPDRRTGRAVRAGQLGLAVPDAVPATRRGPRRRRGTRPRVRTDLARARHGRDPGSLPRPRRAAGLRQPGPRPARRADRRRAEPGGGGVVGTHARRVDGVRRARGSRLGRVRHGTTPRAALRHRTRRWPPTRRRRRVGSGRTTTSRSRCP